MTQHAICTGASDCPADRHYHGCYADRGTCDHPQEHRRPTVTARPDLDALADRLTDRESDDGTIHVDPTDAYAAARILRAVGAAPGPLRDAKFNTWDGVESDPWWDWLSTLADAVGRTDD